LQQQRPVYRAKPHDAISGLEISQLVALLVQVMSQTLEQLRGARLDYSLFAYSAGRQDAGRHAVGQSFAADQLMCDVRSDVRCRRARRLRDDLADDGGGKQQLRRRLLGLLLSDVVVVVVVDEVQVVDQLVALLVVFV